MKPSAQVRDGAHRILMAALGLALLVVSGTAFAQADGIVFDVEIVRVDQVRGDDGGIEERFIPVSEAIPGEVIEYRVTAVNEGDIIYRPGTVVVTLPIGEGVVYLEGTATESSDRVVTEFSADGGRSYAEPPILIDVAAEGDSASEGEASEGSDAPTATEQRAATPAEYDHIRWTFSIPFEPEQEETLVYRVEVR